MLPYAARMKATPGIRDEDVSACFFRAEMESLRQHRGLKFEENDLGYGCGYLMPSEMNDSTVDFITNGLFMSCVSRLTGNSNVLDCFQEWKETEREKIFSREETKGLGCREGSLPIATESSAREFVLFASDFLGGLDKPMGPFISKQHDGYIPKKLQRNLESFSDFLRKFVRHFESDTSTVRAYARGAGGSNWNRSSLIETIVRAMSTSGNFQMDPVLYQLAAQVVLDMEGYFLDFVEEPDEDNLYPGYGALQGLSLLELDDWMQERSARGKMTAFLSGLKDYFAADERETERMAMGLFLDEQCNLRWTITGRKLHLSDAEHFCCKTYVHSIDTHPSRTISEEPRCHNYYSYPRPNPKEWDARYANHAEDRWDKWKKLDLTIHTIPMQLVPLKQRPLRECSVLYEFTGISGTSATLDDDNNGRDDDLPMIPAAVAV